MRLKINLHSGSFLTIQPGFAADPFLTLQQAFAADP
jgi:hypothetical protein